MKKYLSITLAALLLTACAGTNQTDSGTSSGESGTVSSSGQSVDPSGHEASEVSVSVLENPEESAVAVTGDFTITQGAENKGGDAAVSVQGSVYTITAAGEYTLTGNLKDGQVIVKAGDEDEVKLILNNCSISCSTGAPILFLNAGEAGVKAEEGTYNTVTDARTGDASALEESEENYDAAIYAACDLKITGKGTLIVSTEYDNGIKTKDDLDVKNVTLKVTATGNALKGNDSITIKSGSLILISTASDGIKTTNSSVSEKGNQKGIISIMGGHVDIYAACDGISAAYNVEIAGTDETSDSKDSTDSAQEAEECIVNIFTSTYSENTGEVSTSSEIYLIVPSSVYSQDSVYYAYFYNENEDSGVWVECTYSTMISGGRTQYYGLLMKNPGSYQNFLIQILPSGTKPDGANYTASTGGEAVNSSMNGYLISSVSSNVIEGDWVQLSNGSGSNSNKSTYSSKGIKASNSILIYGGETTIYSMDDGLHANADETLENGSQAVGNITMTDGSVTVTAADDGFHADGTLAISGGYVNIVDSHEGLEGNVIDISGGTVFVYGDDDGLNAMKGAQSTLINISGGYLDVTTPSGDTDAIDSNGNVVMSGGFVLVKGGSSSGMMAGSVDVDGSVTVTGGTIVALGGICETPASGSVNTYISSGTSFAAGDYVLTNSKNETILTFTLASSYSSVWIASESIALNETYTLSKDGSSVLTWTQSSSTEGSAGNSGGFGGGGMGGPGGMGGRGGWGGGR